LKLLDANLLLYAFDSTSPHHAKAKAWLEDRLTGGELIGLTWPTVMAFLRIVTNRRLFANPAPIADAVGRIGELLAHPSIALLEPTPRHWSVLTALLVEAKASGPLTMDAELAALAIEHGAAIYSTDRDFRLFRGVEARDPLAPDPR
jgi:toxin-antitoxin system PIN domain toxin